MSPARAPSRRTRPVTTAAGTVVPAAAGVDVDALAAGWVFDPDMLEDTLARVVAVIAAQEGVDRRYHTLRSDGSAPGFPDDWYSGPRGLLARELKTRVGRVSPDQRVWLDRLAAAGLDVGVWRPEDLASGRIRGELHAIGDGAHSRCGPGPRPPAPAVAGRPMPVAPVDAMDCGCLPDDYAVHGHRIVCLARGWRNGVPR